jgi:DNA replication ATP-dependent helicase Dna2
VNVIGEFDDEGKCDIDRDSNFIIVHPDILLSGTRVNYLLLEYCMYMFS